MEESSCKKDYGDARDEKLWTADTNPAALTSKRFASEKKEETVQVLPCVNSNNLQQHSRELDFEVGLSGGDAVTSERGTDLTYMMIKLRKKMKVSLIPRKTRYSKEMPKR